jgi:hypothetical protein
VSISPCFAAVSPQAAHAADYPSWADVQAARADQQGDGREGGGDARAVRAAVDGEGRGGAAAEGAAGGHRGSDFVVHEVELAREARAVRSSADLATDELWSTGRR